jgi:uncharacterized protein YbjT (DUF2867 family)
MNRSEATILVVGGTGHQGGAVERHLLTDGWSVRALVRDPDKPESRALADAGCALAVGDLRDPGSLYQALDGCWGAYLMTTPADAGPDMETQEGFNFVEACEHTGIQHFVFSSVIGVDQEHGTPWQRPKHDIEARIARIGLPATVWRPVTFMENFLNHKEEIRNGHLKAAVEPDVVRQFIAVDDIGRFVALAFREHDRFLGVTAEIASDEMTMPEAADIFSLVLDMPVVFERTEPAGTAVEHNPGPGETPPRRADLETLRTLLPNLMTLEEWIRAQDWAPAATTAGAR